jgi:hypothetical protein
MTKIEMLYSLLAGQLEELTSDPALGYRGQALINIFSLLAVAVGSENPKALDCLVELSDRLRLLLNHRVTDVMGNDQMGEPSKKQWYELRDLVQEKIDLLEPPVDVDDSTKLLGK